MPTVERVLYVGRQSLGVRIMGKEKKPRWGKVHRGVKVGFLDPKAKVLFGIGHTYESERQTLKYWTV